MNDDADEGLGLIDHLKEEGWATFLTYARAYHFSPGEVLISQGAHDRSLHILMEGEVEVRVTGSDGKRESRVAVMAASTIFGEQSFLDARARSASVVTLTAGRSFRLERADLDRLRRENPDLAAAVIIDMARILSLRLRNLQSYRQELISEGEFPEHFGGWKTV